MTVLVTVQNEADPADTCVALPMEAVPEKGEVITFWHLSTTEGRVFGGRWKVLSREWHYETRDEGSAATCCTVIVKRLAKPRVKTPKPKDSKPLPEGGLPKRRKPTHTIPHEVEA
jgi:hypothetical protein